MGLSFHYSGTFNPTASLSEMVGEIEDIARIYKWKCTVYNVDFPSEDYPDGNHDDKLYGISVTPPNCETFSLCFLSNRRMSSSSRLKFYGSSTSEDVKRLLYMLSVKTQYAGHQVHMILIQLLRYVGKKYLQELNVLDEGNYWETNDESQLIEIFKKYNRLLDHFTTAFESFPVNEGETIAQYFDRMIAYVNKKSR